MDDLIQLLPEHVANQIAAGEVVQRPSSVVKELLENAVDAQATQIKLHIQDAGKTKIQVVDNGIGMSVTDLRMAFERHATSKIRATEDIFNILTKGFRGEALASIAAVAQVEAVSKRDLDELGNAIVIEANQVKKQEPKAAPTGTRIGIKNLFYNVPARRNFLKSNHVEFRHIQDEFIRVALAHPNISFDLQHNQSQIYNLPKANFKKRIIQIFGRKLEDKLVKVEESTDLLVLSGFVGKANAAKKKRGEQFLIVNQRFIKSPYLHKAVLEAFSGLLPNGYHPTYFLNLSIDPKKIDINIHPTKTEIKFEDDHIVYALLRTAVKHSLGQYHVAPSLDFSQNPDWAFMPNNQQNIKAPEIQVNPNYNPFLNSKSSQPNQTQKKANLDLYQAFSLEKEPEEIELFASDTAETKNCLQWAGKFLVYAHKGDLFLIDQNRAHQALLYHEFLLSNHNNVLSQQMLFPLVLDFSSEEINQLRGIEKQLVTFGFDCRFAENQMEIHSMPTALQSDQLPAIFADFLSDLEFTDKVLIHNNMAKIMAKNAAVKKGENLQTEQALYLAQELFKLKEPNRTAFGKNVFVRLSTKEILKTLE